MEEFTETPATREARAQECEALANYEAVLADLADGMFGPIIENVHLTNALVFRARARSWREQL